MKNSIFMLGNNVNTLMVNCPICDRTYEVEEMILMEDNTKICYHCYRKMVDMEYKYAKK